MEKKSNVGSPTGCFAVVLQALPSEPVQKGISAFGWDLSVDLLGREVTSFELAKAWAETESKLVRSLMSYAMTRFQRNSGSRPGFSTKIVRMWACV